MNTVRKLKLDELAAFIHNVDTNQFTSVYTQYSHIHFKENLRKIRRKMAVAIIAITEYLEEDLEEQLLRKND